MVSSTASQPRTLGPKIAPMNSRKTVSGMRRPGMSRAMTGTTAATSAIIASETKSTAMGPPVLSARAAQEYRMAHAGTAARQGRGDSLRPEALTLRRTCCAAL